MVKHGVENEELQAYLDGELTAARRAEVEVHLRDCTECAAVLDDLKRVSEALKQWEVGPAPASLHPPAVEIEKAPVRWWLRWQTAAALAASAAVVLVVVSISIPNLMRSRISLDEGQQRKGQAAASKEPTPAQNVGRDAEKSALTQPAAPPEPRAQAYRVTPGAGESLEKTQPEASSDFARRDREADAFALQKQERSEEAREALADRALAPELETKETVSGGAVGGRLAAQSQAAAVTTGEAEEVERGMSDRVSTATERKDELARNVAAGQLAQPEAFAADEAAPLANRLRAKSAGVLQLIAYQVSLTVEVEEFGAAKQRVEQVVAEAGGYLAHARSEETPDQPQRADLTLRVPVEQLSGVLDELRGLGRVKNEQISSEEVTEQVVDLEARLRNARATEQRLIAVLNERTGKVRDILEVEREIGRTRQQVERMDAQRQNLLRRAEMATIQVTLLEEFQAKLEPAPVGTATRLRNAFVDGYESFVGTLLGFAFFFARYGLNLVFWVLFFWAIWRLFRRTLLRRLLVAS
jgi:hypothetical protein